LVTRAGDRPQKGRGTVTLYYLPQAPPAPAPRTRNQRRKPKRPGRGPEAPIAPTPARNEKRRGCAKQPRRSCVINGVPAGVRTPNLLIRSSTHLCSYGRYSLGDTGRMTDDSATHGTAMRGCGLGTSGVKRRGKGHDGACPSLARNRRRMGTACRTGPQPTPAETSPADRSRTGDPRLDTACARCAPVGPSGKFERELPEGDAGGYAEGREGVKESARACRQGPPLVEEDTGRFSRSGARVSDSSSDFLTIRDGIGAFL
jgi:hypothetical protein